MKYMERNVYIYIYINHIKTRQSLKAVRIQFFGTTSLN